MSEHTIKTRRQRFLQLPLESFMVRLFLLLSFCTGAYFNCFAQIDFDVHKPQTVEQAKLKGPVHTLKIQIQSMSIIEGKATMTELRPLVETVYDKRGRMSEAKFYNNDGLLRRSNTYIYFGNLLGKSASDLYDSDGKLYRKSEYQYADDGEISQQINYDYDDKGALFRKTVLIRDASGKLDVKDYKPNGTLFKRNFLGFPQSGRVIKKELPSTDKKTIKLKRRLVLDEIDTYGNWTKMTVFGGVDIISDQKVETREITYRIITYY